MGTTNKELKCIKKLCKYYFESDEYFEVCQLASKYCIVGKCIGLEFIKSKMEQIDCQISELVREYNSLSPLREWIEENQEEGENNE